MPVVIRLMRAGAKKRPFYRIVAADSRRQRDGRFIEILGHYDPMKNPITLVVQKEKAQEWIRQGAQPSEQVASLLRQSGVAVGGAPSKPRKKAEGTAKKKAAKRRVPRKASERKTRAKVARAKRTAAGLRTAKKKKAEKS
jgi:small subunit ribosomal protein S16